MKNDHHDPEETIDEPVMDGATETFNGDEDPRKGQDDPGLIRHPDEGDATPNPFA
ncbi:hypothetical protein JOF28_000911 [Leucobacter exalbidus]|uniref:Uncharacterized protein n=1 Tax=Leucobacter exalbidus TaxID=662960 RepID=A0A940T3F4_9MICO|nr:hypothetical protein [Leucobacter exalbidus]MBP1325679.1 hypothetical protein [Leucobacter exalbidus]